jgi:hypothetical protein
MPASRLAYLVLTYNQPRHLARLIARLAHPDDHFFIHVDAKQDLAPFRDALAGVPNVHFAARRRKLWWAGLSFVKTELDLLRQARASGLDFAQYVLLSGSEYPIKPLGVIRGTLLGRSQSFVVAHDCVYPNPVPGFTERLTRYHFVDFPPFNPRGPYRDHPIWGRLRRWLDRHPIRRAVPDGWRIYSGSTWVTLRAEAVDDVLQFVDDNPGWLRWFRFTYCPEEFILPTILKNGPLAGTLSYDYERPDPTTHWLGAFYIDWHTPNVTLPKTLDNTDFEALRDAHPQALFARKFDEATSAQLLDRIDADFLDPIA